MAGEKGGLGGGVEANRNSQTSTGRLFQPCSGTAEGNVSQLICIADTEIMFYSVGRYGTLIAFGCA